MEPQSNSDNFILDAQNMKKSTILGLMVGVPVIVLAILRILSIWDMIGAGLVEKLMATHLVVILTNLVIYKFFISDEKPGEKIVDKW